MYFKAMCTLGLIIDDPCRLVYLETDYPSLEEASLPGDRSSTAQGGSLLCD